MNIANIFEIANSSPVTCCCQKVDLNITVRPFSASKTCAKEILEETMEEWLTL